MINMDDVLDSPEFDEVLDQGDVYAILDWLAEQADKS